LVLYHNGTAYWYSSASPLTGSQLKISLLAPNVTITSAKLTVWTQGTGQMPPSIDMGEVIEAFAYRHPHEIKKTSRFLDTNYASPMAPAAGKVERLSQGRLISRYDWSNYWIDDVMTVTANAVLWVGSADFDPGSPDTLWWDPGYLLSNRYIPISPNPTGTAFVSPSFSAYNEADDSPLKIVQSTGNTFGNMVYDWGSLPTYGNIGGGSRWFIRFALRPLGTGFNAPDEFSTLDLGPSPNVYDPEFGWLRYEQYERPGTPSTSHMEAFYGDLEPGDPSASFFNEYSYGPAPQYTKSFGPFELAANQSLTVGDMQLVMQSAGNLVLYEGENVRWASGTGGPNGDCHSACTATLQKNGVLVLYQGNTAY
jgi:hypothetical protein